MPDKSTKSNFPSSYGGGWVSAGQYLAEIACERIAAKDGKALPPKFWNSEVWKKIFMQQLLAANSLLKIYAPQAVAAAFRRSKNVYSLRAKFWDKALDEEQRKYEIMQSSKGEAPKQETEEYIKPAEQVRETFIQKPSIVDKLRDL